MRRLIGWEDNSKAFAGDSKPYWLCLAFLGDAAVTANARLWDFVGDKVGDGVKEVVSVVTVVVVVVVVVVVMVVTIVVWVVWDKSGKGHAHRRLEVGTTGKCKSTWAGDGLWTEYDNNTCQMRTPQSQSPLTLQHTTGIWKGRCKPYACWDRKRWPWKWLPWLEGWGDSTKAQDIKHSAKGSRQTRPDLQSQFNLHCQGL